MAKWKTVLPVTYSGCLGDQYTGLDNQTKNTVQVFFFQLYFNKKYVEVATRDFIMHINYFEMT